MDATKDSRPAPGKTTVTRKSDLELVITRTFDAPARLVFEAWTTPALLKQWWAPKSTGASLSACQLDARTGGRYRFEFSHPDSKTPMAFFGKYLEVTPPSRMVWTNEESDAGAVSTLTFEERDGKTLLTLHERYPSKEALDETLAGMEGGTGEQYAQLDELLVSLVAGAPPA